MYLDVCYNDRSLSFNLCHRIVLISLNEDLSSASLKRYADTPYNEHDLVLIEGFESMFV